MDLTAVVFLALALSVDAFIAAFSYGLVMHSQRRKAAWQIAAATGLGQMIMPVLGWYGARSVYHQIEALDHWIAFFVFLVLGLKVIADALQSCDCCPKPPRLSLKILLMIGLATSVDALVAGSMLYFMKEPVWFSAVVIGGVTFINALIGFNFCRIFKKAPTRWLQLGSGVILIGLGVKVLCEHTLG